MVVDIAGNSGFLSELTSEIGWRELRTATAPLLDEIGRYQIRSDIASPDRATDFEEFHSRSGPQRMPGQDLVDVSIGVCGHGDWNLLGEDIYHAVTAAKLRFVQMTSRVAAGSELDRVLVLYTDLA